MTAWEACPACDATGLGPFALAMHLARRHTDWALPTVGFTPTQLEQMERCRADTLRLTATAPPDPLAVELEQIADLIRASWPTYAERLDRIAGTLTMEATL